VKAHRRITDRSAPHQGCGVNVHPAAGAGVHQGTAGVLGAVAFEHSVMRMDDTHPGEAGA
jgi:hypothetical protein